MPTLPLLLPPAQLRPACAVQALHGTQPCGWPAAEVCAPRHRAALIVGHDVPDLKVERREAGVACKLPEVLAQRGLAEEGLQVDSIVVHHLVGETLHYTIDISSIVALIEASDNCASGASRHSAIAVARRLLLAAVAVALGRASGDVACGALCVMIWGAVCGAVLAVVRLLLRRLRIRSMAAAPCAVRAVLLRSTVAEGLCLSP